MTTLQTPEEVGGNLQVLDSTFLIPEEVWAILRVSDSTLRHWRSEKKGPPFIKLSPGTYRYPAEKLNRWLEERLHEKN